MGVILDQSGGQVLDQAGVAILDQEEAVTATTFPALVTQNNSNVRRGLKGGAIIGPMSATIPAALTGTSAPPVLQSLTGWTGSLGLFTDAGAVFSRSVNSVDTTAWGEGDPVRTDITSKKTTCQIVAMETSKNVLATYFQVDPTTLTPDSTTGELIIPEPIDLSTIYYRLLVITQDGATGSETWIAKLLPKASITNFGNIEFTATGNPILHDITFTAYVDPVAGYAVRNYYAGATWLANKTLAGF